MPLNLNFDEILVSFNKLSKKQKENMDIDLFKFAEKCVLKYEKLRKQNPKYPEKPSPEEMFALDLLYIGDFLIISKALNGKFNEYSAEWEKQMVVKSFNRVVSLTERGIL